MIFPCPLPPAVAISSSLLFEKPAESTSGSSFYPKGPLLNPEVLGIAEENALTGYVMLSWYSWTGTSAQTTFWDSTSNFLLCTQHYVFSKVFMFSHPWILFCENKECLSPLPGHILQSCRRLVHISGIWFLLQSADSKPLNLQLQNSSVLILTFTAFHECHENPLKSTVIGVLF